MRTPLPAICSQQIPLDEPAHRGLYDELDLYRKCQLRAGAHFPNDCYP